MPKFVVELIDRSNITKKQACVFLTTKGLEYPDPALTNFLKAKRSGQRSTMNRQAKNNIKGALYTLTWLYVTGTIDKNKLLSFMEILDGLKAISSKTIEDRDCLKLLRNLEEIIVKLAV